jgi:hypothetical protein
MNNYSGIQKFLHRISLSSKFMREISFDLERSLFMDKSQAAQDNHVFVSGLARAGTTILLRAIHASEEFASLSYADMPFVLAPNLWNKLSPKSGNKVEQARAHDDGIMVSTDSPEAFEEVFWQTLSEQEASDHFEIYIQLILKKYKKERYLSKNNQNVTRLRKIIELLPNATILVPFRDPIQHANSLLFQHLKFCDIQSTDNFVKDYMDWIGHSEFGLGYRPIVANGLSYKDCNFLNHWLEQWYLVYSDLMKNFSAEKNVVFVCYESLCSSEITWAEIRNRIEIKNEYGFDFRASQKEIDIEYDQELYAKCKDIYHSLAHQEA